MKSFLVVQVAARPPSTGLESEVNEAGFKEAAEFAKIWLGTEAKRWKRAGPPVGLESDVNEAGFKEPAEIAKIWLGSEAKRSKRAIPPKGLESAVQRGVQ